MNRHTPYGDPRNNPFKALGKFYWYDETGDTSGPYNTERAAMRDLLDYVHYLETGRLSFRWRLRRWGRMIREFIRS